MEHDPRVETLLAPFPADEVKHMPKGGKTLSFIDARSVERRLDAAFGVFGWQDAYRKVGEHDWICSLSVQVADGVWITKEAASDESDIEATKGGQSGAFKRAAAHGFGVGRYLYDGEAVATGTPGGKPSAGKTPARPGNTSGDPLCPVCNGPMWDNRDRNGPDWKCKAATWDKATKTAGGCTGVHWKTPSAEDVEPDVGGEPMPDTHWMRQDILAAIKATGMDEAERKALLMRYGGSWGALTEEQGAAIIDELNAQKSPYDDIADEDIPF